MTDNGSSKQSALEHETMRILIITSRDEDYRQLVIWLEEELKDGFEVDRMSDYELGWAAIASFKHDVCVIDYHLGDLNGLELVRDGVSIDSPAKMILLVDKEIEGLRDEARAAGAADVFEKPLLSAQYFALMLQSYAKQKSVPTQQTPVIAPRDSREMIVTVKDEIVTEAEGNWEPLTGYLKRDLIGRKLHAIVHPNDQKGLEISTRPILNGNINSHRIELRIQTLEGDPRWVECVLSAKTDLTGAVDALEYNFYDIQERKRIESEQDRRLDEMASAIRAKSDFLSSMSHELRTPMNAILGKTEVLLEGLDGELNPRQLESLKVIQGSGKHLLSLINDTLDLNRIEAGDIPMHIEPLMVEPLLQSSIHQVQDMARRKMITIRKRLGHPGLHVHADERRLRQILINLLSNAVKFTPESGTIIIEAEGDIPNKQIQFKVWDTGIGIAEEDMKGLFQRFMQIDSQLARSESGSGLGLALVKHLTELHDGTVTVESEIDEGSCFTITLPWQPGKAADGPLQLDDGEMDLDVPESFDEDDEAEVAKSAVWASVEGFAEQPAAVDNSELAEIAAEMAEIEQQISAGSKRVNGMANGSANGNGHSAESNAPQAEPADVKAAVPIPVENIQTEPDATLILIAEDNEMNYVMLSDYLQVKGYRVALAHDGIEAIDMVAKVDPDLVLMDLQMPEMDGLEAIERLRETIPPTKLPIIGLTALAMPGDKERCIAAGANDYMSKPVVLRELVENIERLVNGELVG